jgi:hypothetical protein
MSEPSIRESIEAAHAELTGAEAAPAAAAPVEGNQSQPQATQGVEGGREAEGNQSEAAANEARARDASGRFAPKAADAPLTQSTEPVNPAGAEPQSEAIRVPASLPAPLKAAFKDLPAEWRDAILKQEESVQTAKGDWASKGQRLNRYEEVVAPHRERISLHGVDEFTWLQRLAAAETVLDRNPIEGITYLARLYGVNLTNIGQQTNGGQQAAPQPQYDPALQNLFGQVQTLQQTLQQQTQAQEQARQAEAATEIQAFRNDPKNLYFDDVAGQIGAILQAGQANTLQEAYEAAIWASPVIRPLLMKEQTAQADRDRQAADRAKAQAAARASGSVTGAPGPASAPGAAGSKGSLSADIRHAHAQLSGQV